jgi:hypothetical protein
MKINNKTSTPHTKWPNNQSSSSPSKRSPRRLPKFARIASLLHSENSTKSLHQTSIKNIQTATQEQKSPLSLTTELSSPIVASGNQLSSGQIAALVHSIRSTGPQIQNFNKAALLEPPKTTEQKSPLPHSKQPFQFEPHPSRTSSILSNRIQSIIRREMEISSLFHRKFHHYLRKQTNSSSPYLPNDTWEKTAPMAEIANRIAIENYIVGRPEYVIELDLTEDEKKLCTKAHIILNDWIFDSPNPHGLSIRMEDANKICHNGFSSLIKPNASLKGLGITSIPKELCILWKEIGVFSIDLSKNNIKEIPAEIFEIDTLQYLDLSKNNIPNAPAILERISQFKNIRVLEYNDSRTHSCAK